MTDQFNTMLDDRFGMFVHFGLYSAMAGFFDGQETNFLGEWIQRTLEIPIAKYRAFGEKNFRPSADFAKNLVANAKKAGIKYIVITSKHHDGFCLFKSDYTDYSAYNFIGRDICRELADECKKEGLELGFYYSHTLDWYEKNAGGSINSATKKPAKNRNFWDYPDEDIDFDAYLYGKCFPQVRELLTNYGDIKLIWFDFPHNITREQSKELRELVKELQPNCLINSRIAHDCDDYVSLDDNVLPLAPVEADIECLITLNDTWGYKSTDKNWKTPEEVIGILCRTLASDASLLLNVGPMGDGSLTPETESILGSIGKWTKTNSEAIYDGIQGNPFKTTFEWGFVSKKNSSLYAYPNNGVSKIELPIGSNSVRKVSILGCDILPDFSVDCGLLTVNTVNADITCPVYKIEFEAVPHFDETIVQVGDRVSLGVLWASKLEKESGKLLPLVYEKSEYSSTYGKIGLSINLDCHSIFWDDENEIMCWDAYFDKPGVYNATLVNANSIKEGDYILTVGNSSNPVDMSSTARIYSISRTEELNRRFCHSAGSFVIEKAGSYRIMLSHSKYCENILLERIDFILSEKTVESE